MFLVKLGKVVVSIAITSLIVAAMIWFSVGVFTFGHWPNKWNIYSWTYIVIFTIYVGSIIIGWILDIYLANKYRVTARQINLFRENELYKLLPEKKWSHDAILEIFEWYYEEKKRGDFDINNYIV